MHLNEQKQENLLVKETINWMRFEMDELCNATSSNMLVSSGHSIAVIRMSKSLGAKLARKMNWDMDVDSKDDSGEVMSPETTVEEEAETDGGGGG